MPGSARDRQSRAILASLEWGQLDIECAQSFDAFLRIRITEVLGQ